MPLPQANPDTKSNLKHPPTGQWTAHGESQAFRGGPASRCQRALLASVLQVPVPTLCASGTAIAVLLSFIMPWPAHAHHGTAPVIATLIMAVPIEACFAYAHHGTGPIVACPAHAHRIIS